MSDDFVGEVMPIGDAKSHLWGTVANHAHGRRG
jgi:hypothetical protein